MANELIRVYGTTKTLVSSGAAVSGAAISAAPAASYSVSADGSNYPDAEFVLAVAFGSAPAEGATISLVARLLNIDGTADADAPEATRADRFIGSFVLNNVTSTQYLSLDAYDVPAEADYYILNNSAVATSTAWTLKVKPRSIKPA